MALAPCVDCILMVFKKSRTRLHEIKKAIDMIPKDKYLGYVMNHQRKNGKIYYY
jgi:hypothetical protein